ncbi:MAG TPA: TolC family protein [Pirellulaceae bacterium]|nr:TolC family protein [Pirellulaceae bacterium]
MPHHSHRERFRPAAAWLALLLALAGGLSTGCTRAFYRRQADIDAYSLVREKANHPHWALNNYSISVDPRSRMYDPYAIDCPPIPPDDPTAHQLMHCVDNKRGWPFWHDNGERPYIENPAWPEYIEVDTEGIVRVSGDDAVRLALLHSRNYQQALESLYLSALDVSFERFRFDAQFFAGYSLFSTFDGRARTGAARQTGTGGNSSSQFTASTFSTSNPAGWQIRKLTTTGGTLIADFANSLVWQFSGPDDFRGSSLLDFTLIQPLLRNAGRDRVLERLTRAERVLLSNVRQMEQYRQGFYVDIMTGSGGQQAPSRAGGQFGSGFEGFTGVATVGFGGGGGGAAAAAAPGAQGGYLALLQSQRQISNQEDNVRRLRRNVSRLTTLLEEQAAAQTGEYLSQGLNVAQARQALLSAETNLLTLQNTYQSDLDAFKVQDIGLPPMVCLQPVDNLLDQFVLIDPTIIRLPEDWEAILTAHAPARNDVPERIQQNVEVVEPMGAAPFCRLKRYPELDQDLETLRPALADMRQFADRIVGEHFPVIQRDIETLRASVPRRKASLQRLIARIQELQRTKCELLPLTLNPLDSIDPDVSAAQTQIGRLEAALADAEKSLTTLAASFERYAASLAARQQVLDQLIQNKTQTPEELFQKLVKEVFNPLYECNKTRVITFDIVEDISRELTELQLLQALARTESVELGEIDLGAEQALELARKYRRDWMNARASLVDSWRLIQFNADQLQSTLDLFFSGDVLNITDNPFRLRGTTGRLRVGVQFDAPITRLAERNTYRQSLIEFQQARRNYYAFEDNVARSLRSQLRSLLTFQMNFELQRLAVLQAARQVMLNAFIDQENQRALTTRATAARDAVQALSDLLNAQNQFMQVFVSYEVLRMTLDLQLGTMQLDEEGLWIDPGRIGPEYGQIDPWLRQFNQQHEPVRGGTGGGRSGQPEELAPPPASAGPPAGIPITPPLPLLGPDSLPAP